MKNLKYYINRNKNFLKFLWTVCFPLILNDLNIISKIIFIPFIVSTLIIISICLIITCPLWIKYTDYGKF